GLAAAIKQSAIPSIDAFAKQAEKSIGDTFNTLASHLGGSAGVTQFQGGGATSHTLFTAQPKSGGSSSSQATQSSWGIQKFQSGLSSSGGKSATAALGAAAPQDAINTLEAALSNFYTRISSDGNLASSWASLQQGGQALGQSTSVGDFLSQAAAELIRAIGLVAQLGVAVGNALLDSLLGAIDAAVVLIADPSTGVINQPLDIPLLSWLFQKLTGEQLTIANVLTLIAAIPITIMWRIVEGQWPSQSLSAGLGAIELGVSKALVTAMTVLGGILNLIGGLLNAAVDAVSNLEPDNPGAPEAEDEIIPNCALTCAVFGLVVGLPILQSTDAPSQVAWASLGGFAGLVVVGLFDVFGGRMSAGGPLSKVLTYLTPWLTFLLNAFILATGVMTWIDANDPSPLNNLGLALTVIVTLPGLLNWIKQTGADGTAFVTLVDVLMAFPAAILSFVVAGLSQAAASPEPAG
ncbi:MAG: hypothetical protein JOZ87_12505, partial [Chloroflexi bacterium]|nr:hypothetical protein [Chloroflexota bacterium]